MSLKIWGKKNSIPLFRRLFSSQMDFDVIVIGGGHAGCEGAAASARCGAKTLLITHNKNTVGEMSCNPSFGGIGKGHLIREIDALDGLCGRVCDKSAITYQALNLAQGPAVLGLRAQIDRKLYKKHMQEEIFGIRNLEVYEEEVHELLKSNTNNGMQINGVKLSNGKTFRCQCVVITTGTFLRAEIYQGLETWPAGRIGEKSSMELSKSFLRLGLKLGRLRTGTPPRLQKETIDFSKFELMPPDKEPIPFSFLTENVWLPPSEQLPTYLGYTNDEVRRIGSEHLKDNVHLASETTSPRYCPSLELKIIRFPELQHRLFLEHEGLDSSFVYPQGMSMTFKPDAQLRIMRAIKGLEKVEFAQPGYGVHYDFVDPKQLKPTLEVKGVSGLFLAGQINGTTGYEEAASQGVIAGINSAAKAKNEEGLTLLRSQAYIGVLIDDLINMGTNEPYRMLTSRAECRLHLRPDNADVRLTELGRRVGSVQDRRWKSFCEMKQRLDWIRSTTKQTSMSVVKWKKVFPRLHTKKDNKVMSAFDVVHRYELSLDELRRFAPTFGDESVDKDVFRRLKIEGGYEKEHGRMKSKTEQIEKEALTSIPESVDYSKMKGLSLECMEKLERARPMNLAAATRISGITPEAIVVVLRHLKVVSPMVLSA